MKKLLRFLFHRAVLIGVSILVQLFLLIFVISEFREYFLTFYTVSMILSFAVVLVVINTNMNSGYKIAWLIPILSFPIFGSLFYLFFGGKKLSKRVQAKMNSVEKKMKDSLSKTGYVRGLFERYSENAANQSSYIEKYAHCPPYKNTYTEYFPVGEAKFARLKEELKEAKKFIFLEYFIIGEGRMWGEILDILVQKVEEGVEVRVMYDDFGCLLTLPRKYNKYLESLGIKCAVFNPLTLRFSTKMNNRDHRKIAVIDGYVGFTGGINLADEYINEYERFGHWKDTAIMLKGEAVWSFTVMFLSLWDYVTGTDEDYESFKPKDYSIRLSEKTGYVQPYTDNPLDDDLVGQTVYLNLINKAKRYVYINTPYLILDDETLNSLIIAAKSGIDVRIIMPHIPDKKMVYAVSRSYYPLLIDSGVRIYEYTPGFMHGKSFVVDDRYGVVGTINLDYRSLYLHYECGVWLYESHSIMDIKEDFLETLELCQEIKYDETQKLSFPKLVGKAILRVLAPLM